MKIRNIAIVSLLSIYASFALAKNKDHIDIEEVSSFEEVLYLRAMSSMIPTNLPWPVDYKDIRHTSIFFDTDDAVEAVGKTCSGGRYPKHLGVDIQASPGSPVKAVKSGVVEQIYSDTSWGNAVVISHDNNSWTSVYWHLQAGLNVTKGDSVFEGEILGTVFDTTPIGDVSHVHFGLRPESYDNYSLRGIGGCESSSNPLLNFVNPYNHLSNNGHALIDDSKAIHVGSWISSTTVDLYTDKGYKALTNGKTGTATYEYTIPSAGTYSIYTRFTPYSDRTANATYKVYINGTLRKTVSVDQSNMEYRGDNVYLVGYNISYSGAKFKIEVSNGGGSGVLISDAILFRKL